MIISESQLRQIIREELLKEGIAYESDLLEEGFMDSLKKAATTLALSTSLMSGLAACGASPQQANNIMQQVRRPGSISAAVQRVRDRQARGETAGEVEATSTGSKTVQRSQVIAQAIGERFKNNEDLIEMMAQAFRNRRLRANPSSEQDVIESDSENARGFIIMKIDEAVDTGDQARVNKVGEDLFNLARSMSR